MNLSKSQKLIYDMDRYAGSNAAINCGCMLLPGQRDVAELEPAVNEMYRLNTALRTRILECGGEVCQEVEPFKPRKIDVLRFDSKAALDDYAGAYAQEPMPLSGTLCEIKIVLLPNQYGLLVKLHHIISDAWTIALMGTQYIQILSGQTPAAFPYEDHLKSEETYLQSPRREQDRAFFLEQFQKCGEVTYFSEKQSKSFASARRSFALTVEQTRQLLDYAGSHRATPFSLFMAAFAAYFSRVRQNRL